MMTQIRLTAALAALTVAACSSDAVAEPRVDRNVIFGMQSGLALVMDVYYPEQPNGYGILHISGSGWSRALGPDAQLLTNTGQEELYGLPLVEAGYTLFNINHRAAPTWRYPAPVEDAQRAIRFIRHNAAEYGIDAERIGAVGGSSGAHLISMLAMMDGDGNPNDPSPANRESAKVQTIVTRAAPFDLRDDPGAPLFGYRGNDGRPGTEEARLLAEASPIVYVTADDPPTLMIHGDEDPTVPYDRSVKMHAALQAVGVESELITVHGGGHSPNFALTVVENGERIRRVPQNPPDYIGAMVAWFDRYLKTD